MNNAPTGPAFKTLTSATDVTVVTTGGVVLFSTFVSPVGELTFATFVNVVPLFGAITVKVRFVACDAVIVPRFQITLLPTFTPLADALEKVIPTGNVSVTVTLLALDGPKFVTEIV